MEQETPKKKWKWRGKNASNKKIAEAAAMKIQNPDLTIYDLVDKTGLHKTTIVQKVGPLVAHISKEKYLDKMVDDNIAIINQGKELLKAYIGALEINSMKDLKSISDIIETSFKQNRLVEGQSTENVKMELDEEQLKKMSTESLSDIVLRKIGAKK